MKKILIGLGFAAINTFVYADGLVVGQDPLIDPEVIAVTDDVTDEVIDDESIAIDNDDSVVFDFSTVGGEYGIAATKVNGKIQKHTRQNRWTINEFNHGMCAKCETELYGKDILDP